MKIRFNRMLSIICAVMLMTCAVSVWAAAETAPATPTDLGPVENGEEEQETEDDPVDSIEILITKNLTLGQSWEGTVGKTKPAVLKLDLERAGTVYMVLEGKDAWATVEKSDRMTGNAPRRQVNPETDELIYSWEAEAGSYIITVGPVEPNLMAMVKVTFMTTGAYDAWEEARSTEEEPEEEPDEESEEEPKEESEPEKTEQEEEPEGEPEPEPEEETEPQSEVVPDSEPEEETEPQSEVVPDSEPEEETEPQSEVVPDSEPEEVKEPQSEGESIPEFDEGNKLEDEPEIEPDDDKSDESKPESNLPSNRSISVQLFWDTSNPKFGDTAHLKANLQGYDDLEYSFQWQYSRDKKIWTDALGETNDTIDIKITKENNLFYWRIMVYIIDPQE